MTFHFVNSSYLLTTYHDFHITIRIRYRTADSAIRAMFVEFFCVVPSYFTGRNRVLFHIARRTL